MLAITTDKIRFSHDVTHGFESLRLFHVQPVNVHVL